MVKFLFRVILILLLAAGAVMAYGLLLPAGPAQQKFVQLKPGSSARHIATELTNAGIIRSPFAFLAWHYLHGRKPLKAGEYAFDHPANAREVYDRIARGDIYFHTVVIPEGYNIFDIATAIEEAQLGKREDFLKVDGFDELYDGVWGREDSDFAFRLFHSGIRCRNAWFAALQAHLHHQQVKRRERDHLDDELEKMRAERRTQAMRGFSRMDGEGVVLAASAEYQQP